MLVRLGPWLLLDAFSKLSQLVVQLIELLMINRLVDNFCMDILNYLKDLVYFHVLLDFELLDDRMEVSFPLLELLELKQNSIVLAFYVLLHTDLLNLL